MEIESIAVANGSLQTGRKQLSKAAQQRLAELIVKLASRAQYAKVSFSVSDLPRVNVFICHHIKLSWLSSPLPFNMSSADDCFCRLSEHMLAGFEDPITYPQYTVIPAWPPCNVHNQLHLLHLM